MSGARTIMKHKQRVLQVYRQVNLKLNKDKCFLMCINIPFFCKIISQQGVSLDPREVQVLTDMPHLKMKKELQLFLGIINYLSKF